jgi:hypothetical protein
MRHLILLSVLLLGVSWAAAQNYPSEGKSGSTSGQQTVQGCLSSNGGTYTLTSKDGKNFQLTGDTARLSEHVGHEVKVTGTLSSESASPSSTSGRTAEEPKLEVTSVKHVSKSCGGKGSSY